MFPEKQNQAYQLFSESVKNNEILDVKTTRLLYLAAAMAFGCYP
jgi:alkylhydroperoxidase/carboxymuconolactone decarboxylase family protein YurZ